MAYRFFPANYFPLLNSFEICILPYQREIRNFHSADKRSHALMELPFPNTYNRLWTMYNTQTVVMQHIPSSNQILRVRPMHKLVPDIMVRCLLCRFCHELVLSHCRTLSGLSTRTRACNLKLHVVSFIVGLNAVLSRAQLNCENYRHLFRRLHQF